jgi:hypothetical protein
MKWILKIFESNPYQVICLWNDGVTRTVSLEEFLIEKSKNPNNSYSQLLNKKRFSEVKCDGTTLYWENGITMMDADDQLKPAALDIDPDVLFEMTLPANPVRKKRKKESV